MTHRTLIIGATGKTGSELVALLTREDRMPRVAIRNRQQASAHFAKANLPLEQIAFREFDYARPETWETALQGIHSIYLVAPPKELGPEPARAFLEKALEKGVKHVTMLSGSTTGDIAGSLLNVVEGYVQELAPSWTILRPSWFMQNMLNWLGNTIRKEGQFYTPAGAAQTPLIDVRDVAEVARATLEGQYHGRILTLTGPELLTYADVARLISVAVGTPVQHIALEDDEFERLMVSEYGWTPGAAAHTVHLFRMVRQGKEARLTQDVEEVLRRPPRSFADFAKAHRKAWM